jgi:hypothetical protein
VEVPKVTTVVQDVPVPFRMHPERIEVRQVHARPCSHVHRKRTERMRKREKAVGEKESGSGREGGRDGRRGREEGRE